MENSKLTGNVKRPILGKESKVEVIKSLTKHFCLTPNDVIAVGDGANDIGMLAFAGTGVAMHAKKIVQDKADIVITPQTFFQISGNSCYLFIDKIYKFN